MSSVDVVVPCYNYARYLNKCVESIINQQDVDVRVLIIDDASTDETPKVGHALAERDPRVYYRRHDKNKGHIETYNEGLLGWASAEYSLLLSSDDMLVPGALRRATRLLDQHNSIGMLYGLAVIITDDSDYSLAENDISEDYKIISGSSFVQHCFQSGNPVPTPTAVVRTKLQHRLGGYRSNFPHTGDMEMWMRFAVHGSIGVLRAVQAYYRWHEVNMSSQYFDSVLRDHRDLVITFRDFSEKWGMHFTEHGYWYDSMVKRFGERTFWIASKSFDNNDVEVCNQCIKFVKEFYPEIIKSPVWWRFQAKRLLGKTLWNFIRPTLDCIRDIRDVELHQLISTPKVLAGSYYGWWPEGN